MYGDEEQVPVATEAEQSVVGVIGVLSIPVPVGGPGEVILPVRGGTEAFAAWCDVPLAKHTRVLVLESTSARSVTVTPFP